MGNVAFFVDLPNFYSRLLKSKIEDPKTLRDYFLDWLDFDLLARSLADSFTGIWVFYSGERIGPSSERIKGEDLKKYVRRINALEGVTARDVNIPGEQREPVPYKCENCGREGISEAVSEKGIDASITVHLFDTMDSWDTAYLLSGDADFVPVVASLRRRGKIVIGAGFSDASDSLIRECFDYIDLSKGYILQDVLGYLLFKKDGVLQKWLTGKVIPQEGFIPPDSVERSVAVEPELHMEIDYMAEGMGIYKIYLRSFNNPTTLSEWLEIIKKLKDRFPDNVEVPDILIHNRPEKFKFIGLSELEWECIKRRLDSFISEIAAVKVIARTDNGVECLTEFALNTDNGEYEPMPGVG